MRTVQLQVSELSWGQFIERGNFVKTDSTHGILNYRCNSRTYKQKYLIIK